METIKERVKALRLGLRLSQTELANRCGVTQPSIANIERGRTTEIKGFLLDALAKELNTTPTYILNGASSQHDHELSMMQAEITSIFAKLSPDDQAALLRTARGMLNTKQAKGNAYDPFPLAKLSVL